jgi:hypothetical protein
MLQVSARRGKTAFKELNHLKGDYDTFFLKQHPLESKFASNYIESMFCLMQSLADVELVWMMGVFKGGGRHIATSPDVCLHTDMAAFSVLIDFLTSHSLIYYCICSSM